MSRFSYLLGVSFFALAACQPAEDAAEALQAETPPPVAEEVAVEETSEPAEVVAETAETEATETAEDAPDDDHDHGEDEDHDHDEHDHDEHDEHDHDEHDHDEHDHEGEDHDDHDHDHAGGEAHVHGLSDLAASIEGDTVSISVEGALANFDLDETIRTLADTTPYETGLVALQGGACTQDTTSVGIRPIGDHGNLTVDLVYTCASMDKLTGIDVIGFQTFAGFEEVKAVLLTDTGQTAETLTASDTVLDLP